MLVIHRTYFFATSLQDCNRLKHANLEALVAAPEPTLNHLLRPTQESPPYPFADDDVDSSRRSSRGGGGNHRQSAKSPGSGERPQHPQIAKISLPYANQPV